VFFLIPKIFVIITRVLSIYIYIAFTNKDLEMVAYFSEESSNVLIFHPKIEINYNLFFENIYYIRIYKYNILMYNNRSSLLAIF
jgi:hypothetical protein